MKLTSLNLFMKSRWLFNAIERPVGASSARNKVWHGYAPYNPRMLEVHLTILRSLHIFVYVGEDGRAPAMRLGLAREPLRYEDVLWPREPVPRPKGVKRKGRAIVVPGRAARRA